jgi:hypothetical protein
MHGMTRTGQSVNLLEFNKYGVVGNTFVSFGLKRKEDRMA